MHNNSPTSRHGAYNVPDGRRERRGTTGDGRGLGLNVAVPEGGSPGGWGGEKTSPLGGGGETGRGAAAAARLVAGVGGSAGQNGYGPGSPSYSPSTKMSSPATVGGSASPKPRMGLGGLSGQMARKWNDAAEARLGGSRLGRGGAAGADDGLEDSPVGGAGGAVESPHARAAARPASRGGGGLGAGAGQKRATSAGIVNDAPMMSPAHHAISRLRTSSNDNHVNYFAGQSVANGAVARSGAGTGAGVGAGPGPGPPHGPSPPHRDGNHRAPAPHAGRRQTVNGASPPGPHHQTTPSPTRNGGAAPGRGALAKPPPAPKPADEKSGQPESSDAAMYAERLRQLALLEAEVRTGEPHSPRHVMRYLLTLL
jgi:hypothetical protein